MFARARSGRHRRPAILPAPCDARHFEPDSPRQGRRGSQALSPIRPRGGAGRRSTDGRRRIAPVELRARPSGRPRTARLRSRSSTRREIRPGRRSSARTQGAPRETRHDRFLQDDRRQGPACRDAARANSQVTPDLADGKEFRPRALPRNGRGRSGALCRQHVEESPDGKDIPRLSEERRKGDRRRSAVAACPRWCAGLDAIELEAGAGGP